MSTTRGRGKVDRLGPAGDGLALSPAQRGGIHDPDLLDVSGASLRDEQEPCLLPGHLIDRCPCLHDPLSALAGTCRTACVSGGAFTWNRSSACVWRRTDKPFGWKIPDEQSTQWRELLSLSLVVHGLPPSTRSSGARVGDCGQGSVTGRAGGRDNPHRQMPRPRHGCRRPAFDVPLAVETTANPLGFPDATTVPLETGSPACS
jgi:hypothetical protein